MSKLLSGTVHVVHVYDARNIMTCHNLLVQIASDTWFTHTETEECCFTRSYTLTEIDASFVGAHLSQLNYQYFIWTDKEVR